MATRTKPTKAQPPGTPTWVPIVGALVAVGGLVWGIASFFIVKPALPVKPVAPAIQQSAEARDGNAINASGNASVSIGGAAPDHPTATTAREASPATVHQDAKVGGGGAAVNAADSARVSVKNH